jgi:gamma-tubulin complex component 2
MLSTWLFTGEINDPFSEFLVNENQSVSKEHLQKEFNDIYWEQRYILNEDAVPSFLESIKDKVLLAGKFLNVIRECEVQVPAREEMANIYFEKQKAAGRLFHFKPDSDVQRFVLAIISFW